MTKTADELKVIKGFAERFRRLAAENDPGMSNKALGRQFGVSDTSVFKWKNAQAMPNMSNACLIALRYRVTVEWLLTGRQDPSGAPSSHKELSAIIDALSPENLQRVLEAAKAFQALEKQTSSQ